MKPKPRPKLNKKNREICDFAIKLLNGFKKKVEQNLMVIRAEQKEKKYYFSMSPRPPLTFAMQPFANETINEKTEKETIRAK